MKIKRARVLAACEVGNQKFQPNQVIEADAGTIKSLGESVDASPGAVKYCIDELKAVPVKAEGVTEEIEGEPAPGSDDGGNADSDPNNAEGS